MAQPNDPTNLPYLPYPIAAAWHRVAFGEGADKMLRLLACYEITLRTLAALLLPDYLRGPAVPEIDVALRSLDKPAMGMWLGLVRQLILHLGQRKDPPQFIAEARRWYFTAADKPTPAARTLASIVHKRNYVLHDQPGVTPAQIQKNVDELEGQIRSVLDGMNWLIGYRLFRVLASKPTKQSIFTGTIQFLTGREENAPEPAKWDVFLVPDAVYLTNPQGTELLMNPFIQVVANDAGEDRVYLLKQISGFRQLTLAYDTTGATITRWASDDELPFDDWLQKRPLDLHHRLKITNSVFGTGASAAPPILSQSDFGPRFEPVAELGRGGMAVVYEVRDRTMKHNFALKVLNRELSEDDSYRERFRREAQNMLRVQSHASKPCIVPMLDLGDLPTGQLYLKMPIMRQGSLNEQIRRGQGCPERTVRGWAENALEALVEVHAENIIHRDIKPSNFLLNDEGRAMLTDFGIALGQGGERLTRTLEQMGTIAYMAPEQIKQKAVDQKADIYSLAVVLHELLTGELPEDAPGDGITTPFGDLIRKMGAKSAPMRPTAKEALAALRDLSAAEQAVTVKQQQRASGVRRKVTTGTKKRRTTAARAEADERARQAAAAELTAREERKAREYRNHVVVGAVILVTLFFLNYVETAMETWVRSRAPIIVATEQGFAEAVRALEGDLDFTNHDATGEPAAYLFSIFYFFAFPLTAIAAIALLLRRRDGHTFLLLATAAAVDYAISLPFYLLFPLPERWADPGSKAILLSDLASSKLIEAFRPFSGLNNCFPSFHVSGTIIIVLCLYLARAPFRHAIAFTGAAILLATFVLGIHWLPDIIAGISAGVISVRIAGRLLPRMLRLYSGSAAAGAGRDAPTPA